MKKIYKKLMVLLDKKQKQKMVFLIFIMLIGAVLETLGVSMILPVMNVVLEEDAVEKHVYLQVICQIFNIDNTRDLMILVMSALVVIFALKISFYFSSRKYSCALFIRTNSQRPEE